MYARAGSLVDRHAVRARIAKIRRYEYLEIDRHRVYRALKDDLGDFEQFIKAVTKLL